MNIEHIFPKGRRPDWDVVEPSGLSHCCGDIGNLTVLGIVKLNSKVANGSFDGKCEYYAKNSGVDMTLEVAQDYRKRGWDAKAVKHRAAHLGNLIATVWRLDNVTKT